MAPTQPTISRRPVNARDPFFAFWADGNPNTFSESRLYFADSTGEHVWQLPHDMSGETAKPELLRTQGVDGASPKEAKKKGITHEP